MRRAHQHAMQLARQHNVGDEAAEPAQEFVVLDAANRRADAFMRQCRAWIYWYSSRKRSRRSKRYLVDTINRSASPPVAVWLAKFQCGIENTSCCDQSEGVLADGRLSGSGNDQANHVAGRALRPRGLALGKPHRVAIERRHHRTAGGGIGVAHGARAVVTGRQARPTAAASRRRNNDIWANAPARAQIGPTMPDSPTTSRRLRRPARTDWISDRRARRNSHRACGSAECWRHRTR